MNLPESIDFDAYFWCCFKNHKEDTTSIVNSDIDGMTLSIVNSEFHSSIVHDMNIKPNLNILCIHSKLFRLIQG